MVADQTSAQPTPPPADPPVDVAAWRQVNRLQLAELIGVHPDTVTDYARQGMPVVTRGGRGKESAYDAVDCLAWWRDNQGVNAKEAAQTRYYEANAEAKELDNRVRNGELIERSQAIFDGQGYTKGWVAKVRSWPRRLTQAGLITRDKEPRVAALCRELLTEIAGWRTVGDARATPRKKAS